MAVSNVASDLSWLVTVNSDVHVFIEVSALWCTAGARLSSNKLARVGVRISDLTPRPRQGRLQASNYSRKLVSLHASGYSWECPRSSMRVAEGHYSQ